MSAPKVGDMVRVSFKDYIGTVVQIEPERAVGRGVMRGVMRPPTAVVQLKDSATRRQFTFPELTIIDPDTLDPIEVDR